MFLDDFIKPLRQYGEECTPGGQRRYCFWFGQLKSGNSFMLYKFKSFKAINHEPQCVIISFTLNDFVQVAKDNGLHISKEQREQLTQTETPN